MLILTMNLSLKLNKFEDFKTLCKYRVDKMRLEVNLSVWTNLGELSVIKDLHSATEIELVIIDDAMCENFTQSNNITKVTRKEEFEAEKAKDLLIILLFFGEKNLKTLTFQNDITYAIWPALLCFKAKTLIDLSITTECYEFLAEFLDFIDDFPKLSNLEMAIKLKNSVERYEIEGEMRMISSKLKSKLKRHIMKLNSKITFNIQ